MNETLWKFIWKTYQARGIFVALAEIRKLKIDQETKRLFRRRLGVEA